jgi:hypothetical protein
VSFTDLDQDIEMIIFGSILTIFEASSTLFVVGGALAKIGLSLKSDHHRQIGETHYNFGVPSPPLFHFNC